MLEGFDDDFEVAPRQQRPHILRLSDLEQCVLLSETNSVAHLSDQVRLTVSQVGYPFYAPWRTAGTCQRPGWALVGG
jgi:hypothetical protein